MNPINMSEFAKDKVHTHGYQRADPWMRWGSGAGAQNRVGMDEWMDG